jgi:hypothetical protein
VYARQGLKLMCESLLYMNPVNVKKSIDTIGGKPDRPDKSGCLSWLRFSWDQDPLVGEGLPRIQAKGQGADRQVLVCLHGLSVQEARRIPPRVDELLRDIGILQAGSRDRPLVEKAFAHVLL